MNRHLDADHGQLVGTGSRLAVEERKWNSMALHLEPRNEFLLQLPMTDWLVADSASVGVAGAEPLTPRPLVTLATSSRFAGSAAVPGGSPAAFRGRPFTAFALPLPARTHTHTHNHTASRKRGTCRMRKISESVRAIQSWFSFARSNHTPCAQTHNPRHPFTILSPKR